MKIDIKIDSLEFEIKPTVRNDSIRGFVNLIFKSNLGDIKIKNGTIRYKEFGDKKILTYEVPAIKGGYGKYNKIFFFDNLKQYIVICREIIKEYLILTGENPNNFIFEPEEVNLDEIPVS